MKEELTGTELLSGTGLIRWNAVFIENATIILDHNSSGHYGRFYRKKNYNQHHYQTWQNVQRTTGMMYLLEQKVFNRLAHLAPAIIVFYALQYIFDAERLVKFLGNVTQAYHGPGGPAGDRCFSECPA